MRMGRASARRWLMVAVRALSLTSCQSDATAHPEAPDALQPQGREAGIVLEEMVWPLVLRTAAFVGALGPDGPAG